MGTRLRTPATLTWCIRPMEDSVSNRSGRSGRARRKPDDRAGTVGGRRARGGRTGAPSSVAAHVAAVAAHALPDELLALLRRRSGTPEQLAADLGSTPGHVLDALLALQAKAANVHRIGDVWSLERAPATGALGTVAPYISRPDGTYLFGAMGDTHLGSKYARLDVLRDLYRHYREAGVDRVFHAGNWIDGEDSKKNKYDLLIRGMDGQIDYLAQEYPQTDGVDTFAVAGNDHEGWYGQREGVDIGRYAALRLEAAGRRDWHHLGFMEAFVPLRHAKTGATTMLHVMHPGGGSAYAVSYTVQKIVEGYEGGEKPAVLLAGHYHKMAYLRTRNVCTIQTGCTQDLTPWARAKKLRYEIGGWLVRLTQDPDSGAITSCQVRDIPYFNRGFYNNRWSHGGRVVLPDRG